MRRHLPLLLFLSTLAFGLGVTLPLVRIDRLFVFSNTPSLLEMISGLWSGGDFALAGVIALFSVLFPALKLLLLHYAAYARDDGFRLPHWVHVLSNWSMLDVVLVALVVFAAKTSGLANAMTLPGFWMFAAAAILTSIASLIESSRPEVNRQGVAEH